MVTATFEVKDSILEWVLNTSNDTLNTQWINKIKSWIVTDKNPTINQVQQLSQRSKIPFGYFFLQTPPQRAPQLLNFRTIDNEKIIEPSKELLDTVVEMETKVAWLNDYRKQQGFTKVDFVGSSKHDPKGQNDSQKAANILNYFDLAAGWNLNRKDAFKFLRRVISNYNITVIVNGVVGSIHRRLDQNEFRAFVLIDKYAPLIFINSRDSYRAKLFSLVHELVHIWYGNPELFNYNFQQNPAYNNPNSEQQINAVVENILMPRKLFLDSWQHSQASDEDKANELSRIFNVSPLATAISAKKLKLISQSLIEKIKKDLVNEYQRMLDKNKSSKGGPKYYTNLAYKLDHNFSRAVMRSVKVGETSYPKAFELLDVKGTDGLNKLSDQILGRK